MKENKKTLILAIIGVLVLVITVVGATYAYYTVTGSSSTSTAAIGATTETTGTVTITQGTSQLYLNVTGDQMSVTNKNKDYYSTTTNTAASATAPTSSTAPTLATISVSGGAADANYSCTFDLSVETKNNGGNATSYAALEGEDAEVVFFLGNGVSGIVGKTLAASKTKITQTGTVTLTGNTSTTIKGYAVFHNLNKSQNDLASLNMNTEVKVTNLSCALAEPSTGTDYTVGYFSGWATSSTNYLTAMNGEKVILRAEDSSSSPTYGCGLINNQLVCVTSNIQDIINNNDDLEEQCDNAGGTFTSGTNESNELYGSCTDNTVTCQYVIDDYNSSSPFFTNDGCKYTYDAEMGDRHACTCNSYGCSCSDWA